MVKKGLGYFMAAVAIFLLIEGIAWVSTPKGIELEYHSEEEKAKKKSTSHKRESSHIAKEEKNLTKNNSDNKRQEHPNKDIEEKKQKKAPEEKRPIKKAKQKNSNDTFVDSSEIKPEEYFKNLISSYIQKKINALQSGRAREDVIIRYYTHKKDGDKVYKLKKYKYYIHERPVENTTGMESNIINYGSKTDIKDIRLVAYLLIKQGINLKEIRKTKYAWKAKAIEISTDPSLVKRKNLTIKEIQNFNKK